MKTPSVSQDKLTLAYADASDGGKSCFYAFNRAGGQGFIIVSADDRANEILAYSDTGSFSYDALPDDVKHWLAGYADQISYLRASKLQPKKVEASTSDKEVKPLLGGIQWNQDEPYNDLCPNYDLNTRCATGCVATAMAQVMYYHRWPVSGTGTHSYQPSVLGGTTLTADFGGTQYAWSDMLPTYDDSSSDASRLAVATLMLHCGVSVDMEYSTSSGSASDVVPMALTRYFNYDKAIAYRTRNYYGTAEWDEVIKRELDGGRPIVALGRSSAGGHAFVFDGYDKNGLIHVNWGWGGMSNGYFRTSALTPATQGIGGSTGGFNYSQYIVTGIQEPQDGSEADVELISSEGLVASKTVAKATDKLAFTLHGMLANVGWQDASYSYGLLITDAKGDTVRVIDTGLADQLYVGYMMEVPEFADIQIGSLPDGSYTVYPVCRVKGGKGAWNRIRSEYVGYPNYINVKAESDRLTFSYPDYFDLNVAELTAPSEVYASTLTQIKATITNTGDADYLGDVAINIVDRQTKRSVLSGNAYRLDLQPGASQTLTFEESYALEAGDYSLTITDDDGKHIASYADITVLEAPSSKATLAAVSQLAFADNMNVDRMNMDITAKVQCTQGVFGGWMYLYLFNSTATEVLGCLDPQYLFLKEGETADVTFGGAFENGVPGSYYAACLIAYNGTDYSYFSPIDKSVCAFRLGGTSSVSGLNADNAEPTAIYDMNGRRLPAQSIDALPKGVYVIKQGGKTMKMAK